MTAPLKLTVGLLALISITDALHCYSNEGEEENCSEMYHEYINCARYVIINFNMITAAFFLKIP